MNDIHRLLDLGWSVTIRRGAKSGYDLEAGKTIRGNEKRYSAQGPTLDVTAANLADLIIGVGKYENRIE